MFNASNSVGSAERFRFFAEEHSGGAGRGENSAPFRALCSETRLDVRRRASQPFGRRRFESRIIVCAAVSGALRGFFQDGLFAGEVGGVSVDLVFRIAAIGLIVSLLAQVLNKAGREEIATLMTLSGVVIVLLMVADLIGSFFSSMRSIFLIY